MKPGNLTPSLKPSADALPIIDQAEVEPRFRAVVARNGERRGIRLEQIYWEGLSRMSAAGKVTTGDLVEYTAVQLPQPGNLTSLLRVLSLKWALGRLASVEDISSMDNLNALVQASPSPTVVLTRDKHIHLFNEAFLLMLRQRLIIDEYAQLMKNLKFSIDTHIDDAMETLQAKRGKTLNTGFSISCGKQNITGQINLALAPAHEKPMLVGYISRF
ncbi:aryl-sulfate sulfotransferase [Rhizobiales bacterium RZME27]|jgi:predicted DNA-binding ribbon-helix-helix protein|uniref:Aryl-sulfate sulfotransferase n=1 Tax=Endobacterium cereale TaxID=2663029 RepID=A0A6A8A2C5_9HYPH|nr:ribbon-helix-helix domain-containing protein [Endobacterium cereale]MEB2848521.1 ribbon-helix-helix domain-containing protein [Endobacterium cereale]MQY45195.1 aryl-sulfate sulfotransferase [Endobacterium cereale]